MKKCLKITIISNEFNDLFYESIKNNARELGLEGTIQKTDLKKVIVLVCGKKDSVDLFLDKIHQGFDGRSAESIQVEPFLKEKDYRGTFRILE